MFFKDPIQTSNSVVSHQKSFRKICVIPTSNVILLEGISDLIRRHTLKSDLKTLSRRVTEEQLLIM